MEFLNTALRHSRTRFIAIAQRIHSFHLKLKLNQIFLTDTEQNIDLISEMKEQSKHVY